MKAVASLVCGQLAVGLIFGLLLTHAFISRPIYAQGILAPPRTENLREAAIKKWEDDIQKLEALDDAQPGSPHHILVVGSSSVRRWDTIERDLAPFQVIQRGFGGAKWSDLAFYIDRLVVPHDFQAVVIFIANGIAGKENDQDPDDMAVWAEFVVERVRQHQPEAAIVLVEVTPSRARYDVWPVIQDVNVHLRRIALSTDNTYTVNTSEHFLTPDGQPRESLFVDDKLHLNDEGYKLWGKLIRRRLDEVLRLQQLYPVATPSDVSAQRDSASGEAAGPSPAS
ncbi:MAG: GDSL-type esterase/lipase family protein [Planctomycetota bacterium]